MKNHFELRALGDRLLPSTYAARCLPLGLTAYADTKDEACEKLKKMFAYWVDIQDKQVKF